jgi:hypothetical protein
MADLSKFGVPLDGNKLGMLQPKLAYRFRVIFEGFGTNNNLRELTANVVSCTQPAVQHEEITVHSYNSLAYLAGKHAWQPIELVVRDDITNAVASAVYAQVQRQLNHFEQIGPVAGTNYKFSMQVHTLDGTNAEELTSWQLDGCFLTNVQASEFNYASGAEFQKITLSIRYDNASLLAGPNDNDGTTVGGDPFPNITDGFTGGTTIG